MAMIIPTPTTLYITQGNYYSTLDSLSIVATMTSVNTAAVSAIIQSLHSARDQLSFELNSSIRSITYIFGGSLSRHSEDLESLTSMTATSQERTLAHAGIGVGSAALGLALLLLLPGLLIAFVLINKRLRKIRELEVQVAEITQRLAATTTYVDQKAAPPGLSDLSSANPAG